MADKDTAAPFDFIRGDATGLSIPAHPDAFRAAGADFLTEAFRAFGSIAPDNRVVRIDRIDHCPGGSTGHKFFLTVRYHREEPGLHSELFIKFSRDFTDSRRDWQRTEMLGEARFEPITRLPGFPIGVPTAYFADIQAESSTGVVITERIFFGERGIEPHRRKCLDHLTLDDPVAHYRAQVTALARLAASHKAGGLVPDIEQRFPFDPDTGSSDPIRYSEDELQAELDLCFDFARRCPQLLPPEVRSPEFLAQMERDALRIREHEQLIRRYLTSNPDLIALCHWNAHIDNCFFYRDPAGELQCGFIDWGRVGQLTFGAVLWGGLSAAHHDVWDHHFSDMLALFCREYHEHGGPLITPEELEFHLTLHMAAMGVARVLAFPEIILFRLPEAVHASGPLDPMFEPVVADPARNCLHVYMVFLKYWRRRDFGAHLDRLLARTGG
jgi:hypothetical protein